SQKTDKHRTSDWQKCALSLPAVGFVFFTGTVFQLLWKIATAARDIQQENRKCHLFTPDNQSHNSAFCA
ncbi:hypothetical protein, partial [Escherichia coli]|uniref:hypothetical protein n=1 Tax=Escherichia coli TaxID=562 RepID=UPI001BDD2470